MYRHDRYKEARVTTAHPGEVVVMLYDGALRFTREARAALLAGDAATAGRTLTRSMDIVAYLQATLKADEAPELTSHLDHVYTTWTLTMVRSNARRDASLLDPVLRQMAELRESWQKAHESLESAKKDEPTAQDAA